MNAQLVIENLKTLMISQSLSEEDVATAVGVETCTVVHWLAGSHTPRKKNIAMLVGTYGLNRDSGKALSTIYGRNEGFQESVDRRFAEISELLRGLGSVSTAANELKVAAELLLSEAVAMSQRNEAR